MQNPSRHNLFLLALNNWSIDWMGLHSFPLFADWQLEHTL